MARKILEDESDRESRFYEGSLPNDATDGDPLVSDTYRGRKLRLVGADDRKELTSKNGAHNWPWRTVGHVRTGCSGALIAPSTVLTAGVSDPRDGVATPAAAGAFDCTLPKC